MSAGKHQENQEVFFIPTLPKGLHLFDLLLPRAGFHHFISSWFFVDSAGRRVVVDPGPASTIPLLVKELSSVTDGVDLILVTHIHLDHSGGLYQLCEEFGEAKVVAHTKGARHLIDPERLWNASRTTLGEVVEMYGPPKPIAPEKLAGYDDFPGIEVIETPGHAPHHISFIAKMGTDRLFFIGEAAGLRLPEAEAKKEIEGENKSGISKKYLRPTTPPKFDVAAAHKSLAKIESALRDGDLLCYAHWGAERYDAQNSQITACGKQLDLWLDVASKMGGRPLGEIAKHLIANDPMMARYSSLPEGVRSREAFFIENAIKGFLEYLEDSKDDAGVDK